MTQAAVAYLDHAPDLAQIVSALPERYPYLLESAAEGPLGRFSMLLRASGPELVLGTDGSLTGPGQGSSFLQRLRHWYSTESLPARHSQIPFMGGWFLYLGYELAGEIEPGLRLPGSNDGLPVALAARCEGAVLISHTSPASTRLVAESAAVLEQMREEIESVGDSRETAVSGLKFLEPEPALRFEQSVERIRDYLHAGDVFQVNLSRQWRGRFQEPMDPVRLYQSLRSANPAPFGGLMRRGSLALLSSSPERLVEVRGTQVQTRPIAGTHPRGVSDEEDRALSRRMLEHPKERAEHIMLIDLERNDLGRVCEPGSVEVDELMVLESYPHVHHIVSNVRGSLRSDVTPVDVISAVFPGGTITGCPKVRCMEIIAELEGQGRGFYTGSMGYLDRSGNLDLNILIRSMLLNSDELQFRTGAGIVADSHAPSEVAETVHKARGLLAALGAGDMANEEDA